MPIIPRATRLIEWIPVPLLVLALRLFFDTNLAVVGGQRHADAAPDEMKELTDEFREIMLQAGIPCPVGEVLFPEVDKRFNAAGQAPAQEHAVKPT